MYCFMKYFIVLFVFLVQFSFCYSQVKNSLAEQGIKGNVIELTWRKFIVSGSGSSAVNKIDTKTIFSYDSLGFLSEQRNFIDEMKVRTTNKFNYNNYGLKIEEHTFYPDGSLLEKFIYKYDNTGNLIEEIVYNGKDTLKPEMVNKFDPKAKEEPINDTDEEKIEADQTEKITSYDKAGNWLKKTIYMNKVPFAVEEREFTYFIKP